MMSWYIETLLINRESIRASIVVKANRYSDHVYINLTGNDYNNLLLVEKLIKKLYESGNITNKEIEVINLVATTKSLRDLEKESTTARHSLSRIFYNVCKKLAFILGGEFTDEGYLNYIQRKYKLNVEQVDQAREYMLKSSLNQT